MNFCNTKHLEKTNSISMQKKITNINKKHINHKNSKPANVEYSLNENLFDPFQSSPPNEFKIKLYMRMSLYNSPHKNEDSCVKK